MYPIEQRLRILEETVARLQDQLAAAAQNQEHVFHGVLLSVEKDESASNKHWLKVVSYPPNSSSKQPAVMPSGTITFEDKGTNPAQIAGDADGDPTFAKVFVLNVPTEYLDLYYQQGDRITYWRYSATADSPGGTDIVRGSYVTKLEDDSFWALIEVDSSTDDCDHTVGPLVTKYKFTAYQNDTSSSDLPGGFKKYQDAHGNAFTGTCWNWQETKYSSLDGTANHWPQPLGPLLTKVYRFSDDAPGNGCSQWQYYFFPGMTGGVTQTYDVPGYVHWDGTSLTQDVTTNAWRNGLLINVGTTRQVVITTPEDCSGGS